MRSGRSTVAKAPLVVGTGLLALDAVITASSAQPIWQWSGGTCGNVLLALRYLGWRSAPVARLSSGWAATRVIQDLQTWGVLTEFVTLGDDGSTPVIVHRIGRTASGQPYHTFSWRCPTCGTRLPGYKPVLASAAEQLVDRLESPKVFFFDRVSRGALVLARASAERGAVVVFEPSAVGNPVLFREAWRLAHIVKYSHERLPELPADLEDGKNVRLQVETLGQDGLRYRSRLAGCRTRTWQLLKALDAEDVKDTAGSGDWCTAGIIHRLLGRGQIGLRALTDASLLKAMRYGQALAVWNCRFEGARGGMYSVDKAAFEQQVERILHGNDRKRSADSGERALVANPMACLCSSCEEADRTEEGRDRRVAIRSGRKQEAPSVAEA
jgi:fructokinase